VSELHRETSPADTDGPGTSREPAHDASPGRGDNPDYYGEAGLGAEYDGDMDAFLAGEDELPTPQESRARTWGDNPEYYDEADLADEYDGDLSALITREGNSALQDAEAPDTDSTSEPADLRSDTEPGTANHADAGDGTRSPGTGDNLQHDEHGTDRGADSQPDQTGLAEADAEHTLSPEQQRISALEAENADARQQIADLKADNEAQAARLDRIEQLLARADRSPATADAHEHGEDKPDASVASAKRDAAIAENKDTTQGTDAKRAGHTGWRHVASAENLGMASTVVGAAGDMAGFAMHATPEGVVGLGATVLGLASLGLAKLEEKRKGKGSA
jgi:hypothetical protein